MVAQVAGRSKSEFKGARPFDPGRDMASVARLLEEAFRPDNSFPFSGIPWLRELGIAFWTLSYAPAFPSTTIGFVWVEDGQVVGNVTLNPDEGRLDRYLITNVAVKPSYRRQGIARALMESALAHLRSMHVKTAVLNVRPNNPGAIKLYQDLGFKEIETRGDWVRRSSQSSPATMWHVPTVRSLAESDDAGVSELLRAAMPAEVQKYHSIANEFAATWEDQIAESAAAILLGQTTRRWVFEMDHRLAALLLVRGQYLFSSHRLLAHVHPDFRGQIEGDVMAFALRQMARLPVRPIRVTASSTHPEWIAVLEQNGFQFDNGLILMAFAL